MLSIRLSESPQARPVVLIHKPNGQIRFCIDFRELNSKTKTDAYALPLSNEMFDSHYNARWFSSLDIKSKYWQVKMEHLQWGHLNALGLVKCPCKFSVPHGELPERYEYAIVLDMPWRYCCIFLYVWYWEAGEGVYIMVNEANEAINSMKHRDMCGNKGSLFTKKIIVDHLMKEKNNSLMMLFHQWNITFELPDKAGQHWCAHMTGCACDLHFANVSENDPVPTIWKISNTLLAPQDYDFPRLGKAGGWPFWTMNYNVLSGVSCGLFEGLHGLWQLCIMEPGPSHQM